MDMKKQTNIFFIVHYICVDSNEIKFEIDTNNDELLETIHVSIRRGKIIIHCHWKRKDHMLNITRPNKLKD